jgi:hypothetical protein
LTTRSGLDVATLGSLSDPDLVAHIVRRDEAALHELSRRHAAALSVLALTITGDHGRARRAVTDVFAVVLACPERVGARDLSVRAQLAGLVYEHCRMVLGAAHEEQVAVALVAFGDHTCPQAAERVGATAAGVAKRLRVFVLDPDRFDAFCRSDDNVVAIRDARPLRVRT